MAVRITLASALGTCFGVQRAIDLASRSEYRGRLTVIGQLVHNPQVTQRLEALGIRTVAKNHVDLVTTPVVMITAHGASDGVKADLNARGLEVVDATCPLVGKLHRLARELESEGFFPVVIGAADHVEVQGVVGNLRACAVVKDEQDLPRLAGQERIGIVSQTTNRPATVAALVEAIRHLHGVREVRFHDTICQPVKDRQRAVDALLDLDIDLGIVIGGRNSSNTRKLYDQFVGRGIAVCQVETAEDVAAIDLRGKQHLGLTAGTSTPQDVIAEVHAALVRRTAG